MKKFKLQKFKILKIRNIKHQSIAIEHLRSAAELDSIASEATSDETEPYALARPEEAEPAGMTCELWLDWFCHGRRTKS